MKIPFFMAIESQINQLLISGHRLLGCSVGLRLLSRWGCDAPALNGSAQVPRGKLRKF